MCSYEVDLVICLYGDVRTSSCMYDDCERDHFCEGNMIYISASSLIWLRKIFVCDNVSFFSYRCSLLEVVNED